MERIIVSRDWTPEERKAVEEAIRKEIIHIFQFGKSRNGHKCQNIQEREKVLSDLISILEDKDYSPEWLEKNRWIFSQFIK